MSDFIEVRKIHTIVSNSMRWDDEVVMMKDMGMIMELLPDTMTIMEIVEDTINILKNDNKKKNLSHKCKNRNREHPCTSYDLFDCRYAP